MKHWIRMDYPPDLPSHRTAGVRICIKGVAACILEVGTDAGAVFFGGPIIDRRFATSTRLQDSEPFLFGSGIIYLPRHVFSYSCTLHHEPINALPYTIHQFEPVSVGPDDAIDAYAIYSLPAYE